MQHLAAFFLGCLLTLSTASFAESRFNNTLGDLEGNPSKLVFLIIENDKYIVSDIRSNRFVELRRSAKERLIDTAEAEQVVVIATNQRYTAYSARVQAWVDIRTQAGERLQSIRADDFAVLITTNKRYLSFNGANGVWNSRAR